jgi:hypothetical protein
LEAKLDAAAPKLEATIKEKDAKLEAVTQAKDAIIKEKDTTISSHATARASPAGAGAPAAQQQYELVSVRGGAPLPRHYVIPLDATPPPAPPPQFDPEWYAIAAAGPRRRCRARAARWRVSFTSVVTL